MAFFTFSICILLQSLKECKEYQALMYYFPMQISQIFRKIMHKLNLSVHLIERETPQSWKVDESRKFRCPSSCQINDLELIYDHFQNECPKFFVDIGGYDGFTYSNTWALAVNGWGGLIFEPDPESVDMCRRNLNRFPGVKVVEMAISDFNGQSNLYRGSELGTLSEPMNSYYKSKSWSSAMVKNVSIAVTLSTLDKALSAEKVTKIGVLSVDVEGGEFEVWSGLDISRFRPAIMIWELQELTSEIEKFTRGWNAVRSDIIKNGYKVLYRDRINTVFVDSLFFKDHTCL